MDPNSRRFASHRVRPPAVAGSFYPVSAAALATQVDTLLDAADAHLGVAGGADQPGHRPRAIVVPHAGYVYSGPVAASAFIRLRPFADAIAHVVLLGPAHRVPVRSMALSSAETWETPLGEVPLDMEGRSLLEVLPHVVVDDRAHAPEHALEVQLPFLQRVLAPGWTLLQIVVGGATDDEVADALAAVWDRPDTLVIISTDLSHYHDHDTATRLDERTVAAIVAGHADEVGPHDACGAHPLRGLLALGARHGGGLRVELVDRRTSGDTAGDRDRVVGYASFLVFDDNDDAGPTRGDEPTGLSAATSAVAWHLAHDAIDAHLHGRPRRTPPAGTVPDVLTAPGASFVTLRRHGELLGCIGSLSATRPLADDIVANAIAAATRDPRFSPVTREQWADADLEVSVLTSPEPLDVASWDELLAALRPGTDGLIIDAGRHRATFLPAVWEQLPDPVTFCEHLWHKAGLRPGAWPSSLQVQRYQAIEISNPGAGPEVRQGQRPGRHR
jgi:AmmeMemoRadiSam system protein B/AmmeMemoRadiSam system protein A